MLIILLSSITVLLFFSYIFNNRNIIAPSVLSCISFFVVVLSACLFQYKMEVSVSLLTLVVVILCLFFVLLGNVVANMHKIQLNKGAFPIQDGRFFLGVRLLSIYVPILVYATVRHIQAVINLAERFSYYSISDPTQYASIAKSATGSGEALWLSSDFFIQGILGLNISFGYICIYCLIYNIIFFKNCKRNLLFFIPIIFAIINSLLTSGRSQLIYYFSFAFIIFVVMLYEKYPNKRRMRNKKILISGAFCFVAFLGIFFILRFIRLGSIDIVYFFDDLGNYFFSYLGASIIAFDAFLQGIIDTHKTLSIFGGNTFWGFYDFLNTIGVTFPEFQGVSPRYEAAAVVYYASRFSTNIYTAIMRYVLDFGYIFTFVIFFFYGLIYGYWNNFIIENNVRNFYLIVFSYFYMPLFQLAIEERLFMSTLSFSTFKFIVTMYICYFYMVKYSKRRDCKYAKTNT